MLTAIERQLRARKAAHTLHGTNDSRALTARARVAFLGRFLEQVDGSLPLEERLRRAEHLRSAYFAGLALKRARSRRDGRQDGSRRKNSKAAAGQAGAAFKEVEFRGSSTAIASR